MRRAEGAAGRGNLPMSHSYTNLVYHLVFGTKRRTPWISPEIRPALYGKLKDGKPSALDASGYKYLALQLYVTGVQSVRIEFITRGNGVNIPSGPLQTTFKVKQGFNTYQVPLKSLTQPPWAEVRVSPKDVLKRLTSVNVVAYCDHCTPVKGTVVIDDLAFQN